MGDVYECWVVDESLALTLRVSQIIGVAPVRFNSRRVGVAFLSRIHFYIGILMALIFDVIAIYFLILKIKNTKADNYTLLHEIKSLIIFSTKISVCLVPLNIFMILNYVRMMKLFRLLTRINDIKRTDNSHFCPKRWQVNCRKVLVTVAPWITGALCLSLAPYENIPVLMYIVLLNNIWFYIEIQFMILAGNINVAFRELNGRLEDVLVELNAQYIGNSRKTTLARLVRNLSRKFVAVCEVMLELNRIESSNLFFHLCILSVNLGIHLNDFFGNIAKRTLSELNVTIAQFVWILYNIIKTLMLVERCHETRQLISRTRILVAKIMVHVTSETIQLFEAVDIFFKQLILNDISYDVMGICMIDRHVISMVLGVTTTIVAITID